MLNNLHPRASYRRVRLVRLVGMMLIVLVQDRHVAYVRNVAAECVGTGIMGKMVSTRRSDLLGSTRFSNQSS